ncbi:ankyrin repeat domain-containing protein [Gaiella sp.]|uniref:ankyrin repeat domain-containing protein n=1 Tax=Gaiella sp. TaxID=2663207 RepID=UPI003267AF4D
MVVVACADESEQVPAGKLVEAAARGNAAAVSALLARGADVDERDDGGRTAVTAAAYAGSAATVRLLVGAGADVDILDGTRSNAFLALGETGDVSVLEEVLPGEPDVTLTNRFGGTALIPAAERGHVSMVRALLEKTDVDVDHVNDLGWTALLEAVVLGSGGPEHQEIVRLLIEAGADRSIADNAGVTALEHARANGYTAIAAILD